MLVFLFQDLIFYSYPNTYLIFFLVNLSMLLTDYSNTSISMSRNAEILVRIFGLFIIDYRVFHVHNNSGKFNGIVHELI